MTLYYVKQDNMSWCCEDDSGPYYEDHEESFVNCQCDIPVNKMTADHLHGCNGGGPVLQWREATEKELIAWVSGTQTSFGDGFDSGVEHERERIIELIKGAPIAFEWFQPFVGTKTLIEQINEETDGKNV